ncbi:MAG: hypothetical protein ACLFVX_01635 [Archaeoglobaceae archaeon]
MVKRYYSKRSKRKRRVDYVLLSVFIILVVLMFIVPESNPDTLVYFDVLALLLGIVLLGKGTWLSIKRIDRINLRSDLNCWGLRVLGVVLFFIGGGILFITSFSVMMATYSTGTTIYTFGLMPIGGLCIIIIGIFSEFRSVRRRPFVYVDVG